MPAVSSDGQWLAFARLTMSPPDSVGIWLYNLATRELRQLTAGGFAPSWLPDGTKLLFDGGGRIFLLDVRSGGELVSLSTDSATAGRESRPASSPDGASLAYDVMADGVYVRALAGVGGRRVGTGVAADWTPDGAAIVYNAVGTPRETVQPQHIRFHELTTGRSRLLAIPSQVPSCSGNPGTCGPLESRGDPAVSPDGRWVAFVGWDGYTWLVSVDGSDLRRLARGLEPAWAPDGASIFVTLESRRIPPTFDGLGSITIWRIRVADGASEELPIF